MSTRDSTIERDRILLRARYDSDGEYEQGERLVEAGKWLCALGLIFGPFSLAAFVVGALAVRERRVLAGSAVMCVALVVMVLTSTLYTALLVDSAF